ncbi:unnamed protein product, partial [Rotaria magnacalcarata]
ADDFDLDQNGEIVYSILNENDHNNLFHIDPQTGAIRALVEFDRQQQDTYLLNIQARDK